MDILLYLSELLQQNTSVGLTGLGTFFKKKFAGRYDKEKQSFLPPGYSLQFTSDVKNENLLQTFISEKRSISAESAAYYIAQFVEDVNKRLEIDHEAELENIGRLFFTEHEGLSFEPSKAINYGSEFYGLPAIAETEVSAEPPVQQKTEQENQTNPETAHEIYDEIAEAPGNDAHLTANNLPQEEAKHPLIENIELDEVKDDLKHTLANSNVESGSTADVKHEEVAVPESVKEQHQEHPNRFGHQPESELPKTYVNLEDDSSTAEKVIEAPEFIKEQHAEHPNRFGNDPLDYTEIHEEESKSVWPKVWIALFVLILLVAIAYFVKPEWFGNSATVEASPSVAKVVDSANVNKADATKTKQDSIAKTDSILKANQVSAMADTVSRKNITPSQKQTVAAPGTSMFHVISVSYATEAAAQRYIDKVKKIGLDATIAKMEGKRKKVSIASFTTKDEAEKQKNILQKRLKGEGFYVKEIKNNTQP